MFGELLPWLTPWADWLYRVADMYGLHPHVTSTYRDRRHQEILYERYLRGQTEYPVAPPGMSQHEYRRAFDMVTDNNQWLGEVWKSVGGRWWPSDSVHFEA